MLRPLAAEQDRHGALAPFCREAATARHRGASATVDDEADGALFPPGACRRLHRSPWASLSRQTACHSPFADPAGIEAMQGRRDATMAG